MPTDLTIRQRHFLKSKDKKIVIEQFKSLFPGKEEEFAKIITPKSRIEWIKLDQNQSSLYGGKITNPKELQDLQIESDALHRKITDLEDKLIDLMIEA